MCVNKEVLVEKFLLVKESLWLYILSFMVPFVARMYCLTGLLVFQWLCTLCFSVGTFLGVTCFFIPTVLLFVGMCGAVYGFDLFVVAFYDLR